MRYHPYHFVPLPKAADYMPEAAARWEGPQHDRLYPGHLSGTFHCKLETLSLFTIRAHFEKLRERKEAYIPGSSLRGMARTLAQMLGFGCGRYFFGDYHKNKRGDGGRWPSDLDSGPDARTCRRKREPAVECSESRVCLVCRIFGYAGEGESDLWRGKAAFHCSEPIPVEWRAMESLPDRAGVWMAKPQPRHKAFYAPEGAPSGWKIYRHSDRVEVVNWNFPAQACVPKHTVFPFRVDYKNLTPLEYAVLRFVLTLEYGDIRLAHKLGYGKPVGMGSCRITLEKDQPLEPKRYFGGTTPQPDRAAAYALIEPYLDSDPFTKIRQMLDWDKKVDRVEYPTKDPKGKQPKEGWFDLHPDGSIANFEQPPLAHITDEDLRETVLAQQERKAAARRAPVPQPNKSYEAAVIAKSKKNVSFELRIAEDAESYGGVCPITKNPFLLGRARIGDKFRVKVETVDEAGKTVTISQVSGM